MTRQMSGQVALLATKGRMRVMAPSPPLAVKIWVHSVECLFTFVSLQTSFERVINYGYHQRFTAMRRNHVCPSSNKCVLELTGGLPNTQSAKDGL